MNVIDTLRRPRLFGFVLFDWIATLLGALLLSNITGMGYGLMLFILLVASIFLHIYFDIPTNTNYYLGLSEIPKHN